jgi:hypothetical protein
MNRQGRRTVELVAQLRTVRGEVEERGPLTEGGQVESLLDFLSELIADGEYCERMWRAWLHGEEVPPPPPAEARMLKGDWLEWHRRGKRMTAFLSKSPEEQLRTIYKWREEEG